MECLFKVILLLAVFTSAASAESLTKEQGDQILRELKEIKQMLARQQPATDEKGGKAELIKLDISDAISMGRDDAPMAIVAFIDYQCPYCKKFQVETFPQLSQRYVTTGKVRYIVSSLPLDSIHPSATKAAEAALCAEGQRGFWAMHEKLMSRDARLDDAAIKGYAASIGLDPGRFADCLEHHQYAEQVKRDAERAKSLGVHGTPSFLVGRVVDRTVVGHLLVGAQPAQAFEARIQEVSASLGSTQSN